MLVIDNSFCAAVNSQIKRELDERMSVSVQLTADGGTTGLWLPCSSTSACPEHLFNNRSRHHCLSAEGCKGLERGVGTEKTQRGIGIEKGV